MQRAFEKIKKRLDNLGWVFADYYPDGTELHKERKKSVRYDEVVEIVNQVASEYGNSFLEELIEAKRNCGEDSDCSACIFGQVEDKCYLAELQIGNGGGWILCSERLPEDDNLEFYKVVNISLKDGTVTSGYYRNKDNEWWGDISDGNYENVTDKVLAWQPLPEPYEVNRV